MDGKMTYFTNAVSQFVQNHGWKSYLRRFYEGQSPLPTLILILFVLYVDT